MSFFTRSRPASAGTDPADPDVATRTETEEVPPEETPEAPSKRRRVVAVVLTTLAALLVLFALLAPNRLDRLGPGAFVRIPVEGLVGAAILLVLPPKPRRIVAALGGAVLGLLTIVKVIDMGFFASLDRPFDLVFDWSFFPAALDFLTGAFGKTGAMLAVIGAGLLAVALVVLTTLAVVRLARVAAGRRTASTRVIAVFAVAWIVCSVFGVELAPGEPIAARSAAAYAYDDLRQVRADLADKQHFASSEGVDAFRDTPAPQLLNALRGKDVLFTFVESYGRVAVQDSELAPPIDALLDDGTAKLKAAGFGSRSAFLTSSTQGGGSWLAHSTLQSGLWVNNQQRYNDLLNSNRFTLGDAFRKAGWKTVWDVPEHTRPWPEGVKYYGPTQYFDAHNVGYHGPGFAYSTMPDQYTLSTFQHNERGPAHQPVMAEIDLVSSHAPWSPRPSLVDWNTVGDGSVFDPQPAAGVPPETVWKDPEQIRLAYGQAIQYSLSTLISYVQHYGDDNLVLVFLGDHQPPVVTGPGDNRDVPITIVAKDPAVLAKVSGWGWQDGLHPSRSAPVEKMDSFRDRFLTTFAK